MNRAYKNTHEWATAQQTMHAGVTSSRKDSGIAGMDTATVYVLKYAHKFLQFSAYQWTVEHNVMLFSN